MMAMQSQVPPAPLMSITHAGKVTARAGEHVLRHVAPLMPHEFIQIAFFLFSLDDAPLME